MQPGQLRGCFLKKAGEIGQEKKTNRQSRRRGSRRRLGRLGMSVVVEEPISGGDTAARYNRLLDTI